MKYVIGVIVAVIISYAIGWGIWCALWWLVCKCFSVQFVLAHATGAFIVVSVVIVLLKQVFGGNK